MMKKRFHILLAVVTLLFLCCPVFASTETNSSQQNEIVSLKLQERPFSEVAAEINRQTGYTVIFDEKWNSLPISGHYNEVSLDEFFRRVFRKQNTSLLIDNQDKLLVVRFFGDKSFEDLLSGAMVAGKGPGNQQQIPEEIRERHRLARLELEEMLNDPNTVDPISGKTVGEINATYKSAVEEMEIVNNDPETIDPISGMKRADIDKIAQTAPKELEQLNTDPSLVEPNSGMTRAQIDQMHQRARAEVEAMMSNPDTVDPISGMKLSEIRAIAERANQ